MLRKFFCVVLALCLVLGLCACGTAKPTSSGEGEIIHYKAEFKSGEIPVFGDVFNAPKTEESSVVALGQASSQAGPDDSVIVMGEGFESLGVKAYVYSQSTANNGKAKEASFYVTEDQTAAVTIDKSLDYGVYGIYFEQGGKKSNMLFVNTPKIWWVGLTKLTAGETLKIYGENLTTDNQSGKNKNVKVYLRADGKYCELKVTFADPYKVTAQIPQGLENGKEYEIVVHSGHGGDLGFAVAEEKLVYCEKTAVEFKGKTIDVTEFGANGSDSEDDSAAIQQAFDSAQDGDIIFFPVGKYHIEDTLSLSCSAKLMGVKQNDEIKSTLVMGLEVKEGMISAGVAPLEITNLHFWDVRKTNLLCPFINYDGDSVLTGTYQLKIHDCKFSQQTNPRWDKVQAPVSIQRATNVIIENNDFTCSQMAFINFVDKLYINNNVYTSTFCINTYMINANALIYWHVNMSDASYNGFYSRHNSKDSAAVIEKENYTTGRAFALQNYTNNLYIAYNKVIGCGLPNANGGEQIMFENGRPYYEEGLANITADGFTAPDGVNLNFAKNDLVVVTYGKGKGQTRIITGLEGKRVILNKPFNVVPDGTSRFLLTTQSGYNSAIHRNEMMGYSNYYNDWGATCGVQIYSQNDNIFVTENSFSSLCYGVCVSPHISKFDGSANLNSTTWIIIQDNAIKDVNTGIRYNLPASTEFEYEVGFGVAIRRNSIENAFPFSKGGREGFVGGDGISMGEAKEPKFQGEWINSTLIENNTFKNNMTCDIYFYYYQNNTILRNNTSNLNGDNTLKNKMSSGAYGPQEFK